MRRYVSLLIMISLILGLSALPAMAREQGLGHTTVKSHDKPGALDKTGKKITDEVMDSVTDELIGKSSSKSSDFTPPGLEKKGKTPPGLAKKDKVPPGWQKSEKKTGEEKEGWIRRTIKGLFKQVTGE